MPARSSAAVASVWPRLTVTPCARSRAISASAPGRSGATVTRRTHAARDQRVDQLGRRRLDRGAVVGARARRRQQRPLEVQAQRCRAAARPAGPHGRFEGIQRRRILDPPPAHQRGQERRHARRRQPLGERAQRPRIRADLEPEPAVDLQVDQPRRHDRRVEHLRRQPLGRDPLAADDLQNAAAREHDRAGLELAVEEQPPARGGGLVPGNTTVTAALPASTIPGYNSIARAPNPLPRAKTYTTNSKPKMTNRAGACRPGLVACPPIGGFMRLLLVPSLSALASALLLAVPIAAVISRPSAAKAESAKNDGKAQSSGGLAFPFPVKEKTLANGLRVYVVALRFAGAGRVLLGGAHRQPQRGRGGQVGLRALLRAHDVPRDRRATRRTRTTR